MIHLLYSVCILFFFKLYWTTVLLIVKYRQIVLRNHFRARFWHDLLVLNSLKPTDYLWRSRWQGWGLRRTLLVLEAWCRYNWNIFDAYQVLITISPALYTPLIKLPFKISCMVLNVVVKVLITNIIGESGSSDCDVGALKEH